MASVLVVEDDPSVSHLLRRLLAHGGYEPVLAATGCQALQALEDLRPDLALVNLRLPDIGGLDVVAQMQLRHGPVPAIVLTAIPDYFEAARGVNLGVWQWLEKPVDNDVLLAAVAGALAGRRPPPTAAARQRPLAAPDNTFDGMVGRSPVMLDLYARISKLAPLDGSILIEGDTGTGKELAAQSLHSRSRRRGKTFVTVHAGAIPETLFEAQLFGHEAGAFTDARETRAGWFEAANGGTLFLDEIGEMPLPAQAKLLRVMEERQVVRLGSRRFLPIDVRIIAATNRNLNEAIAAGQFRRDLYHRFQATLHLPPLRAREDDIDALIDHYLPRLAAQIGVVGAVSDMGRRVLRQHRWPGNVRELQNVLRESLVAATNGIIDVQVLQRLNCASSGSAVSLDVPNARVESLSLPEATARLEATLIGRALERTNGNREAAARLLEIDPKTLWRKLSRPGEHCALSRSEALRATRSGS